MASMSSDTSVSLKAYRFDIKSKKVLLNTTVFQQSLNEVYFFEQDMESDMNIYSLWKGDTGALKSSPARY
jgi:hypothetical protein